jgi:hypothetical protein
MSDTSSNIVKAPLTQREPALVVSFVVGLISGLGAFLTAWGEGQDWRIAAGIGIGVFVASVTAGGIIRQTVYSPDTANRIMDADTVISELERRGY